MVRNLRVGIVGYGIAGIAAAIHLRRQGHCISHFERNDLPVTSGAGMLLHPSSIRLLCQLGVSSATLSCGAPVQHIRAQTAQGRMIMSFSYGDIVPGGFGLGIQRNVLHQLLSNLDTGKDRVHSNHKMISTDSESGYLFDDLGNRFGPFDVIVIADGANSIIRHMLPIPARYNRRSDSAALVGLLSDVNDFAANALTQYFDGPRHLSVWPVGCGLSDNKRRCSIAINVPLADAIAFRDNGVWRDVAINLCPGIRELIESQVDNSSMYIFSYKDVELDQLATGRVALIGDAAHSMSPQLGNGAQLAMEDASMLADAITGNNDEIVALRQYSRNRVDQLSLYHRASRWITPMFQSDSNLLALFRDNMLANALLLPGVKRMLHSLIY